MTYFQNDELIPFIEKLPHRIPSLDWAALHQQVEHIHSSETLSACLHIMYDTLLLNGSPVHDINGVRVLFHHQQYPFWFEPSSMYLRALQTAFRELRSRISIPIANPQALQRALHDYLDDLEKSITLSQTTVSRFLGNIQRYAAPDITFEPFWIDPSAPYDLICFYDFDPHTQSFIYETREAHFKTSAPTSSTWEETQPRLDASPVRFIKKRG